MVKLHSNAKELHLKVLSPIVILIRSVWYALPGSSVPAFLAIATDWGAKSNSHSRIIAKLVKRDIEARVFLWLYEE